ncbi:MAG: DUF6178 family protein [Candidatus Omnitrophica bacterium]|nr:DUF6178 family protein [Candidatus Omnitrophota bacterium]MDD5671755.1 DUF6178 family protein [Candidatus Omnitrophota bacterium]
MISPEEFQNLDAEEQAKVFLKSKLAEKGELLLLSHQPERLAASLSREELYLVTRQVDLEERSAIIRYASLPQLFFIADIECWEKDRMNYGGFARWLETLQKADERKCLAWLVEMDYETVVSGFKGLVRVIKAEREYPSDELLGDKPYFTLDDCYYICGEEDSLDSIKRAFELLIENHRGRYAAVLEGIIDEMDDILEEEALHNREARLLDRGFPDSDSAHRIYRPLSMKEFEAFPRKNLNPAKTEDEDEKSVEQKAPNYLVLWTTDNFFLDEVLLLFKEDPPGVYERIQEEMAWIANKIISCEGIDFSSEERVRHGAERARRFTSIGLEILSGGQLIRAKQWMTERWLENIFRLAATRLLEIRDAAHRIVQSYWEKSSDDFLQFLMSPYEFILRGLLLPVPEQYDSSVSDHPHQLRDFKTLGEVERAQLAVRQFERIHAWLRKQFPNLFRELCAEMKVKPEEIRLSTLLGTLFASFVLRGKIDPAPLSPKELDSFFRKAFELRGKRYYLMAALKEKFLGLFPSRDERELLTPLWGLVFQEMEDELGGIQAGSTPDLRYIQSLRTSHNGARGKKKNVRH